MSDGIWVNFDPERIPVYCSACGSQLIKRGHMTGMFYLCPKHGEFTMAPLVMFKGNRWQIHFNSETEQRLWETCRYITHTDIETVRKSEL